MAKTFSGRMAGLRWVGCSRHAISPARMTESAQLAKWSKRDDPSGFIPALAILPILLHSECGALIAGKLNQSRAARSTARMPMSEARRNALATRSLSRAGTPSASNLSRHGRTPATNASIRRAAARRCSPN